MLEKVKLALRITTDAFDEELNTLISAAIADLGIAGITKTDQSDYLIYRAVITFCKMNFGDGKAYDYDRLKASYDEQKSQLSMATGYTDWLEDEEDV